MRPGSDIEGGVGSDMEGEVGLGSDTEGEVGPGSDMEEGWDQGENKG